jgi:hypothetical protein
MQTFKFDISGMTCGGCTTRVTPVQFEAAITSLGYPAKLHAAQLRPVS